MKLHRVNNCLNWSIASEDPAQGGDGQTGYVNFNWDNDSAASSAADVYNSGATYACGIFNVSDYNSLHLMCVQNAAAFPQTADAAEADPTDS